MSRLPIWQWVDELMNWDVIYCVLTNVLMDLELSTFIPIIKEMVYHISIDDYASIERKGQNGDILVEDLAYVIHLYPYKIIPLPDEAFDLAKSYFIEEKKSLDVYIPFWTKEEGRSDLMLALSCYMNDGIKEVIIFDVYVP